MVRFEDLLSSRVRRRRYRALAALMAPFSIVMHYLEGDSIPLSHVYPLFQSLFDYVICLPSAVSTVLADMDEGIEATIVGLVTDSWEGTNRLVGLRHDVHLATFFFDPFPEGDCISPLSISSFFDSSSGEGDCKDFSLFPNPIKRLRPKTFFFVSFPDTDVSFCEGD